MGKNLSFAMRQPRLDVELRLRISNAIDRLIDLLDQDDALDPAHECEGQELFDPARGWVAICPDIAPDISAT